MRRVTSWLSWVALALIGVAVLGWETGHSATTNINPLADATFSRVTTALFECRPSVVMHPVSRRDREHQVAGHVYCLHALEQLDVVIDQPTKITWSQNPPAVRKANKDENLNSESR